MYTPARRSLCFLLQGLLKKLMSPDPTQRPSADALLRSISAVGPVSPAPAMA